ncbi:hypothetical protein RHGRI_038632 [Rhododendron griersonianum]|uniref:riboflavin kinase n=1 Tax=Rhododendron griersonianum TaxID=479676 RepID=A0AAV6HMT1_9ERIC|nr:hypothetical protein RHGRI_038632 [Rhododendron griersonianum]
MPCLLYFNNTPPVAKAGNQSLSLSLSLNLLNLPPLWSFLRYQSTQPNCLIRNQFLGKILFKMPPSFSHIHKTKLGFPMNNFNCKTQNSEAPIAAVILDLDGTLLNTEQATKGILGEFLARYGKVLDREKEDKRLGMMHNESAISIVKDYELPITPDCWREHFAVILGSDQVNAGKPSPDLFLEAAKQMGVDPVHCLVIEDSLVGVKAAKAAGMKVVAVPSLQNAADQYSNADSVLHSLLELQPELWGLPAFDDWVGKALPIDEPFYLRGWYSKGLLCLSEDSEESALPDQLFGLFFGWVKFDAHEVFKVVASIGWDYGCCTCKRKFLIHLLDISNEHISEQEVQILLVGYIRGLSKEENKAIDTEIPEQDKSVARVSLDLPEFTRHKSMLLFPEASLADDYAASDEKEYAFSD